MNRSDLNVRLAGHFPHLTQKDLQIAVDLMLDAIAGALTGGRRAEIRGFGSFTVHYRPAKVARNPRTGEPVPVTEKYVPHFKPGKGLQEAVQSNIALAPWLLAAQCADAGWPS